MANHFYGGATHEHYEKDVKDFTASDKVVVSIMFAVVVLAIGAGFLNRWGIMVALIGAFFCMPYIAVGAIWNVRSKATLIFVALGILLIGAGIIVETGMWDIFQYYATGSYIFISLGVGIICMKIAIGNFRKLKQYSLEVEALCEIVDVQKLNLFTFDDRIKNPYNAPINANIICKPGFHYCVNGNEYYTESTIYYGDLNTGFAEGSKVKLKVNPDNPYEILPANEGNGIGTMAMVMGICWIVAGIVGIVVLALMLNGVISFIR